MTPVFVVGLRLTGRRCLVVGNGDEAVRRAVGLADAGAEIAIVTPEPSESLSQLARQRGWELAPRAFEETDLDAAWLVVQADRDAALAARIGTACCQRKIFFCAVDEPAPSSYAHLAIVRSGPVSLAISSSGRAPALVKKLGDELSRVLDAAGFAAFAERIARLRERTPRSERRELLSRAVEQLRFDGTLQIPPPEALLDE